MYDSIIAKAEQLLEKAVAYRRDFHKYCETGWLEMRTASIVAGRLSDLGYEVMIGREVCDAHSRMGLPEKRELTAHYEWAAANGADKRYLRQTRGGYTGVMGILRCGEGPVVALRFDMDAIRVLESAEETHLPAREGFASAIPGTMHACGHDAHTAIGLIVAELIMNMRAALRGTVKLIFQPAEEGVRGAVSIANNGCLDDVDYIFAGHIYPREPGDRHRIGIFRQGCCAVATTKLDAVITGKAAHAGMFPEQGKNAMLAAANAVLSLYAIPRRGDTATQVNVGSIRACGGRNVICDRAELELEVRGETSRANGYMEEYARRIIKSAADMHGCKCSIRTVGRAEALHNSPKLSELLYDLCENDINISCEEVAGFSSGSEDFSCMADKVSEHGGQALYFHVLSDCPAPNHSVDFDFEESAMSAGIKTFCGIVYKLLRMAE